MDDRWAEKFLFTCAVFEGVEMEKSNAKGLDVNDRIRSLVENLPDEKKQVLVDLLLEWQQKEQRADERIPCLIPVDYADQKRIYRDFIQDMSKGGVFIETREPFRIGGTISLTFTLPPSQSHFKIAGKIVRAENPGIAVQFETKLSRYQEEIIRTHTARKT
jgi:Tfp pilus assembly protein PilZ